MEIISFVGSSAAVKKSYSGSNFTLPRISKVQKKVPARKTPEIVVALDKAYSKTERQFTFVGISKIISVLVFFAVIVLVPYTIFNLLYFMDNHTTSIVFDSNFNYEYEALSGAMSRFAMYDTLADNID